MGVKINKQELIIFLQKMGVKKGQFVIIHSAFSTIKNIENGPQGLIDAVMEIIDSEGTLAMPCFNFSILHQGDEIIYDLINTPSELGILTETFRKLYAVRRTHDLFNPFLVLGKFAKEIKSCPNHTSWDQDSPYPIFYRENAHILGFGVDYNETSIFHYAEQKAKVPYRFFYQFKNAYLIDENNNKVILNNSTYRRIDDAIVDMNNLSDHMEQKKIVRLYELDNAIVRSMRVQPLIDETLNLLAKDPYCLIQKAKQRIKLKIRVSG